MPYQALPPRPTAEFRGYPFYIPGEEGHRPPQPPIDFDCKGMRGADGKCAGEELDGGLPRHVISKGSRRGGPEVVDELVKTGGEVAELIARRVLAENGDPTLRADFTKWDELDLKFIPSAGTPEERKAMEFHNGRAQSLGSIKISNNRGSATVDLSGAQTLGGIASVLAHGEGLQAHAQAAEFRLKTPS